MLTGIRQLRRTRPLEWEIVDGLRVPTLAEMARVKKYGPEPPHSELPWAGTYPFKLQLANAARSSRWERMISRTMSRFSAW